MPNTVLTQQAILFLTSFCYKKIEKYNHSLNGIIIDSNKKAIELGRSKVIAFKNQMMDYFNHNGDVPTDEMLLMDFYYYMYDIISTQRLNKNSNTDVEGLLWFINKIKNQHTSYI